MFNSTHTFVGLTIARTGLDRWVPRAAITAVIAANLPDIDIVTGFAGTATYLRYHRGITHTFVGIPLLALIFTGAMYPFLRNFLKTYVVALIAMGTHPALDFANTYGLRPFFPWNQTWYYGDLLPIIDPFLDVLLVAGILAGIAFKRHKRLLTWVSLSLVVGYLGTRLELRSLAAAQLQTFAEHVPGAEKWSVSPTILSPLVWDGIIQSKKEMQRVTMEPLRALITESIRIDRPSPSIPKQVLDSEAAATLLAFARYPIVRIEGTDHRRRVLIFDFRFYSEPTNTALAAEVILDRSLNVMKESISFEKRLD